jgi:POT family proton-dependent oligopeptide transporter
MRTPAADANAASTHDTMSGSSAPSQAQPGVLYMLFATEAWERFSFYGMRAILKLYMMKGLLYSQGNASLVYGFYTGLVYLTPLVGGYMADRVLGYRVAILLGGLAMAGGQFFLSTHSEPMFWAGLACLILGNGFFKPNISTVVGTLYEEGDPRRDRGFTIFYMGINLGAMLSPIVCGQLLGENEAWLGSESFPWGFRAAGIGMIIGVITFFFGQRWLGERGRSPRERARHRLAGQSAREGAAREDDGASRPLNAIERGRVLCIFLVGLFVIFFWVAFEQAGNTMTTFADDNTRRIVFGWEMKASLFQFVNPVFILLLAPIVSWIWKLLDERKKEPSTPAKMVLGLGFLGLGFVPLVAAAAIAGPHGQASWMWLVLAYFLHTVGELCLSPVGLSFVTKLAPNRLAALLMGVWFLAVWAGNTLAGITGYWYDKMAHTTFFAMFVVSSLLAAGALFSILRPVKRLMGGIR